MPILKKQKSDDAVINHTIEEGNNMELEANDTFVDQLKMNAEAIINYLKDRGMTDGSKIAIGGHSYGRGNGS